MITLLIRCCHLVVHYEGECVLEPAQACISVSIENRSLCGVEWGEQVGMMAGIQKSLLSWLVRQLRRVLHLFCAVFVEYEAPAMWIDVVFPQFEQFEVLGCGRGVELVADQ